MLRVENLEKNFGGLQAVRGCSFEVEAGRITGLIGPNGAGKTTIFNMIAGAERPSAGRIIFEGEDIAGLPTHSLFHRGILRTFQIPHEFGKLTVLENLMVVPPGQSGENLLHCWLSAGKVARQEAEVHARAEEVLEFLSLAPLRDELAENLSGGQKKLLELGRTMMVDAKIVFLDEVGAGVNRTLLKTIGTSIQRLNRERGYTFCMIEHDMDFISRMCNPVIVMAEGKLLTQGTAEEVVANEEVIEAYLGTGRKHKRNPRAESGR